MSEESLIAEIEVLENRLADTMLENERLRETLKQTDSAICWLKELRGPTVFHIKKWADDGVEVIRKSLSQIRIAMTDKQSIDNRVIKEYRYLPHSKPVPEGWEETDALHGTHHGHHARLIVRML